MFLFVNKSQEKTKTNNALQVLPVFPDPDTAAYSSVIKFHCCPKTVNKSLKLCSSASLYLDKVSGNLS